MGTIAADELESFLTALGAPLRIPVGATNAQVLKFAADVDVCLVGGQVSVLRTLYKLIRRAVYYPLPVSHQL